MRKLRLISLQRPSPQFDGFLTLMDFSLYTKNTVSYKTMTQISNTPPFLTERGPGDHVGSPRFQDSIYRAGVRFREYP